MFNVHTINANDLKDMLTRNEQFVLIYVLDKDKFTQAHIPNSHNIPVSENDFLTRIIRLAPNLDRKIVVYCDNSQCHASAEAAQELGDAGYHNVYEFKGGIEEWQKNGNYVEASKKPKTSPTIAQRSTHSPQNLS